MESKQLFITHQSLQWQAICNIQLWKRLSLEKHNFGSDRVRKITTLEIIKFGKAQNWQSIALLGHRTNPMYSTYLTHIAA